ncbi:VOC family protein [Actinomadura atramentaria]|uniref:VOC family protein n=1 Tax=Actinomadura atramentaria TaxID=1990 RepID=UPI00035D0B01|nr:VOC family protein [Actinomadura atramentaria]
MTRPTTTAPTGTPAWLDLTVPDPTRAKQFYGALFGWEFVDYGPETGHYTMCRRDGLDAAAIMPPFEAASAGEPAWKVYFATDDCDASVRRAEAAGGTVLVPADDVAGQGRAAALRDPAGGRFGLWEGREHVGARIVDEPGSLVWNELVTAEPGTARAFYTELFDQTAREMPADAGIDYTTLERPDGHVIGGIHGMPDAPATSWLTYFGVEDADEAVRIARDAGGVTGEPWDSPYGRAADVRDPFGTPFRVIAR